MRSPIRYARGTSGFTLLEILVALAILGILASILYGTLRATLRLNEVMADEEEIHQQARLALTRMATELATVFPEDPQRPVGPKGAPSSAPLVGVSDERDGRPADELRFLSLGHLRAVPDVPESDLAEITYAVVEGETGWDLEHRENTNLLSDAPEATRSYVLVEGIRGLNLRYFDGKEKRWRDEWDADRLPVAVEITLLLGRSEPFVPFRTVVRLPLGQS